MSTNFTTEQGDTFGFMISYQNPDGTPMSFEGCSIRMQIRRTYKSTEATETLSSETGEINLLDDGKITFELPADRTLNIPVEYATNQQSVSVGPPATPYVYDVKFTHASGRVDTILFGTLNVRAAVTR